MERVGADRLGTLFDRHADGALRLAYLLTGDRQLAEDLVQDAFVRMVGRFQDLRDPSAFEPYLKRTIVNLSRSHFRRLRVERSHVEREKHLAGRHVSVLPDLEGSDELMGALKTLPQRQRAAIVLRFYEDLSEQQTADALGCSVVAVKSLTNRGMATLRQNLRAGR